MDRQKIIIAYEKVRGAAGDDTHAEYEDAGCWISVARLGQALQVVAAKDGEIDRIVSDQLREIVDDYVARTGHGLIEQPRTITPDQRFLMWFEGICPQCRLEGRETTMLLNRHDLFECPDCRLMASAMSSLHMIILHMRGNGDLKPDSGHYVDEIEHPTGRILCREEQSPEGKYFYPFRPGEFLVTEEDLRAYLASIK